MRETRFPAAGLLAGLLLSAACSDSGSMVASGTGRVRLVMGGSAPAATTVSAATLSDGSGRQIVAAEIELSSVLARNLDGQLVDVTVDLPMTVDLIGLVQGHTVELPVGSLPVGTYDQLVVVIRALHVELSDGTQVDVTPPGGGWTAIVPAEAFDVVEGQLTTVNLRFRADGAFRFVDGHLEFDPEFDCDTDRHHHDDGDDDDEDDD
ncbi:MAG TPA: DUF4382 domain-containing protein [Candidatus Polarisedimenticolaceae bacterium]|nr:DUF4382 domain-containing protein [Candidatus Polarisedimenticolaceae bacterium]